MTADWNWRSVPGVKTEMDRDYSPADEAEDHVNDEPRRIKPRYCHECRRSFGCAPGCPNEGRT